MLGYLYAIALAVGSDVAAPDDGWLNDFAPDKREEMEMGSPDYGQYFEELGVPIHDVVY